MHVFWRLFQVQKIQGIWKGDLKLMINTQFFFRKSRCGTYNHFDLKITSTVPIKVAYRSQVFE